MQLVLGGVRSGKSRFAQQLAAELGGDDVLFVATAAAHDDEMQQRIAHHRQSRPANWQTLECPQQVANSIENPPPVVLLDCLTLLVSNLLCDNPDHFEAVQAAVDEEVDALISFPDAHDVHLIIVSGEVGAGVVPEHKMGRQFRDLLGFANQQLAKAANATYWMVAGLPVNATKLACSVAGAAEHAQSFRRSGDSP